MNAPVSIDRARHRFTLDDWAAMDAAGILPRDMEFELIDGALIEMPADGPGHRRFQHAITRWIIPRLPEALAYSVLQTLPKDRHNGPKPDLYVFDASIHEKDLWARHVVWAIEIADTSLGYDLKVKAPLYASAGIPEFWVIDVNARAIHVMRDPVDGAYREVREIPATEAVSPLCAPALAVRIADLPRID
jgi:Uma2 family endonuclease